MQLSAKSTAATKTNQCYRIKLTSIFCKSQLQYYNSTDSTNFSIFFAASLAVVILSTSYDVYLQLVRKTIKEDIFAIFSLYTNSKSLLSTSSSGNLTCLFGIRVISTAWVILGHFMCFKSIASNTNTLDIISEVF
jgi:hypothetical protein